MSSSNPLIKIQQLTSSRMFMLRLRMHAQRVFFILLVALLGTLATAGAVTVARAAVLALPSISPTKADVIINDGVPLSEAPDGKADPGETIEYTVTVPNTGTDATGVNFTDTIDPNTTLIGGSLNVSPLAGDDSYETTGNTLLEVGVAASGNPAVRVTNPAIDSILDNDTEFQNDLFVLDTFVIKSVEADTTAPFTTSTFLNGSVTVQANGTFSYTPPVGSTGVADHFDYIITDDGTDSIPGNADDLTGSGRVTITINAQRVWYVKNDAGAGDGRSSSPFNTLSAAQAAATAVNDTVYVSRGDGTTTGQSLGISLTQNGERLIGEGVALTVPVGHTQQGIFTAGPTTLKAAGLAPMINNTTGGGSGVSVTNLSNVQIRGLNIAGNTNAVDVSTTAANSGSFELADNVISAAGVEGIDVNGGGSGTLTVNLHDNTVTATGNGIDIQRTAGSVTITTFDDNVVTGATGGIGINVVGNSATVLFDSNPDADYDVVLGGVTAIGSSGASNGVGTSGMILNNVTGDIGFTDLDIYADSGNALLIDGTTPNFNAAGATGFRLVASGNNGTFAAIGGAALDVKEANINIVPSAFTSSITTAIEGVSLVNVSGTLTAPLGSTITSTNVGGTGFFVDGSGLFAATSNVNVTYAGTITADIGTLVQIQNVNPTVAATYTFSGQISDNNDGDGNEKGILLDNNDNGTVTFSGGLAIRTTSNAAFTATNGGRVNATQNNGTIVNTLTSGAGIALNVNGTNIGASDLTFRSISANGGSSGILLNSTGSSGGLTISGNGGTCTSAATCTGGAIQNETASGVSLTNTQQVLIDRLFVQNTGTSGIGGTQVVDFTLTNSKIDNSGTTYPANSDNDSNVGFGFQALVTENNLSGVVVITGNTLTNAFQHGIDIQNFAGTITDATITNNTITSSTVGANTHGSGIRLLGFGHAGATSNITKATVSSNTIMNFPGGAGITAQYGNNSAGPAGAWGTSASATDRIFIENNIIQGQSAANPMGANAILMTLTGKGQANWLVNNNGTVGQPIANIAGTSIGVTIRGVNPVARADITNNRITGIVSVNAQAIAYAADFLTTTTDAPQLFGEIRGNNISGQDGEAIQVLATAGSTAHIDVSVKNNVTTAPNCGGCNRFGITAQVGSSSATTTGAPSMCLDMSGNTAAGSGVNTGIGIRKKTAAFVFQVEGFGGGGDPTAFLTAANPAGGGVIMINQTTGFGNCSTPVGMAPNNTQVLAQAQPETTSPMVVAQAPSMNSTAAKTFTTAAVSGVAKLSKQAAWVKAPTKLATTGGDSSKQFAPPPAPAFAPDINVAIGNLPANKTVVIKYRVLVRNPIDNPIGALKIENDGNITFSGGPGGGVDTDNSGLVDCETGPSPKKTCTPIDRPDTTVTSINRSAPATTPTNLSSVTWAVTFADPIDGLTASNFTLVNVGLTGSPAITGVSPLSGPTNTWMVTASTGTGQGTLNLTMTSDAGLSHDVTNGNTGTPFTTGQIYDIDHIPPTTTSFACLTPACINPTNADTLVFRVTFSEDVQNVGLPGPTNDFTVTGTTATVTSIFSPGVSGPYDLTVSGGNLAGLNGTVGLNFDSTNLNITDAAGNALAPTEPGIDETYTLDNTVPTVSMTSAVSNPTNTSPIPVTVQFSETVTGFTLSDVTPVVNGSTSNFVAVDGDTYTFDLTPTADGLVTADIGAAVAIDGASNPNTAASQFSRTYDGTVPTVSMTSAAGNPTTTSPIPVTVQFSETVTGFTLSDITPVVNGSTSNFVAVDGDTYTFDLTPTVDGLVTADIGAAVAIDGASNPNTAASQFSRTYDGTAPTVSMTSAAGNPTNASPIPVTVQFSETVTGFTLSDITPVINGSTSNFVAVDGDTYTFDLTPTVDGIVTADIGAAVAIDGAGNPNTAASQFSRTYDGTVPTVSMSSVAANPTNVSPIPVTVQFSETVTGFTLSDITPVVNGSTSNFVAVDGDTYTFDLTPTVDGLVTADIGAAVAIDGASNPNTAASQFSRTYDGTAPTVSMTSVASDPTGTSPIPVTVQFSETVTGFTLSDVTPVVNGSTSNFVAVDGDTYTFDLTPAADGIVTADIGASVAQDTAGNPNTAASQFSRLYDTGGPTVSMTSATGNPTNANPIPVTVQFSETVTGFTLSDVTPVVNGSTSNFVAVDGDTYTFDLTPIVDGLVTADIGASVATDGASNPNSAASQFSRTYDGTAPTVSMTSAVSNPTNTSPIPVTVQFSETVTGFTLSDVTSVVNGSTSNFVAVDGDTYTFDLTPTADGIVSADIGASVATDTAGNGNTAASQFSRTYDGTAPTVSMTSGVGNPTTVSPIPVTVQFSETVTGFTLSDVTPVVNGSTSNFVAVDGDTYTFDLTPTADGLVTADIGANKAFDTAGNGNTAASQFSRTYDTTGPTVSMTSAAGNPTNANPIPVTVQFSETVTGFTLSDITPVVNGSTSNFVAVDGDTYTFDLTPTADGLVTADIGAAVAIDGASNPNTAASQFSRTYDGTAPTVSMSSAVGNPTNTSPIPVTVQFSETVTGFTLSDITPVVNGSTSNFVAVDGDTYTFDLTPTADGLVTADIGAGVATDTAGNGNTAASQFSRTYDGTAPTVSMSSVAANPTNVSPIPVTVQFSETVTGFTLSDITPVVNGSTSNFVAVDGDTYTFDLTPTADGTVSADIGANKAFDAAANGNTAATQFSRTYDSIGPTATLSSTTTSPTNTSPILVTITFNEPVTGVGAGDLSATNATTSIPTGGPTVYTFNLTPIADGLVTVKYLAGSASDAANNPNPLDSNLFSITYDTTVPTVTINQKTTPPAQADPTGTSPINFTAIFSEPISLASFTNGDVILSGAAAPTTAVITQVAPMDGTTFNVAVSGMSASGPVTAAIAFKGASDLAGNASNASTTTTPGVTDTVDYIYAAPPVITEGNPVSVIMSEDGSPTPFALTLHATDANGDPLTWSIAAGGQANYGTAGAAAGPSNSSVISYTPLPNYNGPDTFVVEVTDGLGGFDTINVNVTIQPVADSPSLIWNQSYSIKYDTWFGVSDSNAFGGGYRKATSGIFTFHPTGAFTKFKWLTYRGPDQGKAQVIVDGVVKATIDLYRATAQWQYAVEINGLTHANHTIVIKALGTKNPASSGKWVAVDGFKTGLGLGTYARMVYDDQKIYRSGTFSYGSWVGIAQKGPRFGAFRISDTKDATMDFFFDGTQFTWVTARGKSYGKADIYVDGVFKQRVDLYKASQEWQYRVTISSLTYGSHHVVIKVLKLKNSHSTGFGVICDGFEIE